MCRDKKGPKVPRVTKENQGTRFQLGTLCLCGVFTFLSPGLKGLQGATGIPGTTGVMGGKGVKGDPGFRGERGKKGDLGERGIPGNPGPNVCIVLTPTSSHVCFVL